MRLTLRVFSLLALAPAAVCQSINVDIGGLAPGGAGAGTPAPVFGAAAHQPGMWNYIFGIGTGPYALVDLQNNSTTVSCTRSDGMGGAFGWNNSMTTGYFQALMDDGHNTAVGGGTTVSYTFTGLAPGRYVVFTYAWSPLDPSWLTSVSVPGSSSPDPQIVGGSLTALNTFTRDITHSVHVVSLQAEGTLTVTASTAVVAGIINGIQISKEFRFGMSQTSAGGSLTLTDSGGVPGNAYVNLMTVSQGSFPNGPIFGLDMSLADALNEIAFGLPFVGILDPDGSATYIIPPPVLSGLVVYAVGIELDAIAPIVSVTPPFAYTIQ